jgi:hypothetical protein
METHYQRLITGLAVLAPLLVGSFGAEADDEKLYPGIMCVQRGSVRGSLITYDSIRSVGEVCNNSGQTLEVSCPVIHDDVTETWKSVSIIFNGVNPSGNAQCDAIAFGPGVGLTFSPVTHQPNPRSAPTTGVYEITFGQPSNTTPRTSYFVSCRLPSGVCIDSYDVVEP